MSTLRTLPARLVASLLFIATPSLSSALPPAVPTRVSPEQVPQPSSIAGQWNIEWELGRRVQNEDVQVIRATGVLTVRVTGDSLVATIDMKSRDDGRPASPPLTLTGKSTPAGAVLSQIQQMRLNVNGDERAVDVKVAWTLTATGDSLKGEIVRDLPSDMAPMGPMPPATVSGTRIKG